MDNSNAPMGIDGEPLKPINGGNGAYRGGERPLPDLQYAIHAVYKCLFYGWCQPAEAIVRAHALAEYVFSVCGADERLIEELESHARDDMEKGLTGADDPYFQGVAEALYKIGFDNFRNPLAESADALSAASGREPKSHQYSEPPSDKLTNPIDTIFDTLNSTLALDTYEALRRIKPLADGICAGLVPDDLMDLLSSLDENGLRLVTERIAECADGKSLVEMAYGRAKLAYARQGMGIEAADEENWGSEEDLKPFLESANVSEETYDDARNFLADIFPMLGFTKPHAEDGDGAMGHAPAKSGRGLYGIYKAYEANGIDLAMLDKSIFYLYQELERDMKPEDAVIVTCEIIKCLSSGCVPPDFPSKLAGFAASADNGEFSRYGIERNPYHEIREGLREIGIPEKLESVSSWGIANGIARIISTRVDFDIDRDFDKPPFKETKPVEKRYYIHSGNDCMMGGTFDRHTYNVFDGLLEAICFDSPGGKGEQGMSYSDGLMRLNELAEYCGAHLCEYDFYSNLNLYFGNSKAHANYWTCNTEKFKDAVSILKDREPCPTDGTIKRLYECMMGSTYRAGEAEIGDGIFNAYPGLLGGIAEKAEASISRLRALCTDRFYYDFSSLGVCALEEYIASGMASDEFLTKLAKLEDLPPSERDPLLEEMAKEIMYGDYGVKSFYSRFFGALYESAGFEPDPNNDPKECALAIDDLDEACGGNMIMDIIKDGHEEKEGTSLSENLFKMKPFYETSVYGLMPRNILDRIYGALYGSKERGLPPNDRDMQEIARAIADCPAGENPFAKVAECLGFMPYGHIMLAEPISPQDSFAKAYRILDAWMEHRNCDGYAVPPPATIMDLEDSLDNLADYGVTELINKDVKDILEDCGFAVHEKGIGWKVLEPSEYAPGIGFAVHEKGIGLKASWDDCDEHDKQANIHAQAKENLAHRRRGR